MGTVLWFLELEVEVLLVLVLVLVASSKVVVSVLVYCVEVQENVKLRSKNSQPPTQNDQRVSNSLSLSPLHHQDNLSFSSLSN